LGAFRLEETQSIITGNSACVAWQQQQQQQEEEEESAPAPPSSGNFLHGAAASAALCAGKLVEFSQNAMFKAAEPALFAIAAAGSASSGVTGPGFDALASSVDRVFGGVHEEAAQNTGMSSMADFTILRADRASS
jgi:hypothetical protein